MRAGEIPRPSIVLRNGLLEYFLGVEVYLFCDDILNSGIGAHRQSLGCAGDEVELAASVDL